MDTREALANTQLAVALRAAANASEMGTYLVYNFHISDVKMAALKGGRVFLRLFTDPDEGITFSAEDAIKLGSVLRAAGQLSLIDEKAEEKSEPKL